MKLSELKKTPGSKKKHKQVGRGQGSGHGKTSCRGHKGQLARSGGGRRPGYEGGQMPLYRRLAKRGFNNIFQEKYNIVNISTLNRFKNDSEVTPKILIEKGIIKRNLPIKILGNGKLERKLNVSADKFSESAKKAIKEKGGSWKEI